MYSKNKICSPALYMCIFANFGIEFGASGKFESALRLFWIHACTDAKRNKLVFRRVFSGTVGEFVIGNGIELRRRALLPFVLVAAKLIHGFVLCKIMI